VIAADLGPSVKEDEASISVATPVAQAEKDFEALPE